MSPDDFAALLFDYLHKLKKHSYINQEQQAELRKRKEQLQPGEVFQHILLLEYLVRPSVCLSVCYLKISLTNLQLTNIFNKHS